MSCHAWCTINPLMKAYHDQEWGVPLHDDRALFEFLMLEALQCGLSWDLILKKREALKEAFRGFDPLTIATFGERDVTRIMATDGVIHSERKIRAVIKNARAYLAVAKEYGSFDRYLWGYTKGKTLFYKGHGTGTLPPANGLSRAISRDLKKRGFSFVGPVTIYSYLEAVGVINDHDESCPRYQALFSLSDAVWADPFEES